MNLFELKIIPNKIQAITQQIRWDIELRDELNKATCLLPEEAGIGERLYFYYNSPMEIPKCKTCDGAVKFKNFKEGYKPYCSRACWEKSDSVRLARSLTNMNKYGGASPFSSKAIREKSEKTSMERYGVPNCSMNKDFIKKGQKTLMANYGVSNPSKSSIIQQRKIETYLQKYGVEHWSLSEALQEKSKEALIERKRAAINVGNDQWICKVCDYPFHSIEDNPSCPICSQKHK